MLIDMVNWKGGASMQMIETNTKRIICEVAEECKLLLEMEKKEVLHIRKSRRNRNADCKYVKWLGVIFDDSLDLIYITSCGL